MNTNRTKQKCYICKGRYDKFSAIKVLKVPVDDARRERWSRSCGVDLPLYARVCYNHFVASDFRTKPNEKSRAFLMPAAVPKPLSAIIDTSYLLQKYPYPNDSVEIKQHKAEPGNRNLEEPLIDILPDQSQSPNLIKFCFICHKTFESDNVVLYDIPKSEEYHKLWCTKFNRYLPIGTKICENHFCPNDFIFNTDQQNCLKLKVIPSQNLLGKNVEETPSVNILYINPKPETEEVKLPANPLDDAKIVEGCIMLNKLEKSIKTFSIKPNVSTKFKKPTVAINSRKPNVSNKSIQTDGGYKNTCGYIEASTDFKLFSMNCSYCNETFPIWRWKKFVSHLIDVHQQEEQNLKNEFKDKSKEAKNTFHTLRNIRHSELKLDSCNTNQEFNKSNKISDYKMESNSSQDKIKVNILESKPQEQQCAVVSEKEITVSQNLNKKTSLNDTLPKLCTDKEKKINENEIDNANFTENSNLFLEFDLSTDVDKTDNDDDGILKEKVKEKKSLTLPCYLCENFFEDKAHLEAHQVMRHNVANLSINQPKRRKLGQRQCNICNRTFKRSNQCSKHMAVHRPPEFKCHICGKDFRWELSFDAHVKLHSNQRDHVCELCGASFVRISLYYDHKRREHSDEHKYVCQICDYRCKTSTQLSMHRKKWHSVLEGTIEELYFKRIGNTQGKRTNWITKYPIVVDPITKLKRIKCDLCDMTYARHGGLKHHRLKVHCKLPYIKKRQQQFDRDLQNKVEVDADNLNAVVKNEMENLETNLVEDDNLLTLQNNKNVVKYKVKKSETNLSEDFDNLFTSESSAKFDISYVDDAKNSTAEDLIVYDDTAESK